MAAVQEAVAAEALCVDLKLLYFGDINNIQVSPKPAGEQKALPALLMIHAAASEETGPPEKELLINDLETLFLFS